MTSQYIHPCVADIKMGRVTYDQDAPLDKRERETNKWPPMAKLGYRICGMMVIDMSCISLYGIIEKRSGSLIHNIQVLVAMTCKTSVVWTGI